MTNEPERVLNDAAEDSGSGLRWPPPGLERMQGDLHVIAGRAALSGGLLVLPLLYVAAREQGFATLGPLADAWWVTIVLSTIGLAFGLDAITRLARSFRRASRAVARGYDGATVLRVLADSARDMGFLMTGSRHFSVIEPEEREGIAAIRIASALLLSAAGLWLIVSMSIGLFLAAQGWLSPVGLQAVTLVPGALLYVLGGASALVQEARIRRARKKWHQHPWADDLVEDEIRSWQHSAGRTPHAEAGISSGLLGGLGIAVGALSILIAIPVATLVPTSAIGPILTAVSVPSVDANRPRAVEMEAFRSYAIEGDVSITPEEAGALLQNVLYVGVTDEPSPGEREPSRRIEEPWLPDLGDAPNPLGIDPYMWGDSLIDRAGSDLDRAALDYLQRVADHPAREDFSRLARATAIDIGGARWSTPFPAGVTMATVPVPRFASLREAANSHIAAAAWALVLGREEVAEGLIREVVSVGFLLADEGPTLIDNLIGYTLVEGAGAALGDLYRTTGRNVEAAELSRLNQVAERSSEMMRVAAAPGTDAWVRSLPDLVLDTTVVRGLRWEYFINLATMGPCLNMHRMIFGADDDFDAFIEDARASLVRWPTDEALFEIARFGWVGQLEPAQPSFFGRIVGLYMSTDENSCGRLLRHMGTGSVF